MKASVIYIVKNLIGVSFYANVKKGIKQAFVHNALVDKYDENWRTFIR